MNYKKMRLILIILLIFTNCIMFFNIIITKAEDKKIYQNMILDNIKYLEDKGVFITSQMLEMDNINTDALLYDRIDEYNIEKIISNISSSENDLFIGENGTAKINSDGSFAINLNETHTKESIEKLLIQAEFDIDTCYCESTDTGIKYTMKMQDSLVSNCFFEVILNSNTTTIAGEFVFSNPTIEKSSNTFSVFMAIVELYNYYNFQGEIDQISFEYKLENIDSSYILPVLKVEISGNLYYYNIFDNFITTF